MRSALGVASGNYYLAVGVFATNAADGGPGILFGGGGDGAGVQHHELSSTAPVGAIETAVAELLLNGGTVGLGGPAAEIFDVKAGHGTILAYARLRMGEGIRAARAPNLSGVRRS